MPTENTKNLAIQMRKEFHSKDWNKGKEKYRTEWKMPPLDDLIPYGVYDNTLYESSKWNGCDIHDDPQQCRAHGCDIDEGNTGITYTHTYGGDPDDTYWNNREYYEPIIVISKDDDPKHPKQPIFLGNVPTRDVGIDYSPHTPNEVTPKNWKQRAKDFVPKGKYLTDLALLKQIRVRKINADGTVSEEVTTINYSPDENLHLVCNATRVNGSVEGTQLFVMKKTKVISEGVKDNPTYEVRRSNPSYPPPKIFHKSLETIYPYFFNLKSHTKLRFIKDQYRESDNIPMIVFDDEISKMLLTDLENLKAIKMDRFQTNIFHIYDTMNFKSFMEFLSRARVGWSRKTKLNRILTHYRYRHELVEGHIRRISDLQREIREDKASQAKYAPVERPLTAFGIVLGHLRTFFLVEQLRVFQSYRRDIMIEGIEEVSKGLLKDGMVIKRHGKKLSARELNNIIISRLDSVAISEANLLRKDGFSDKNIDFLMNRQVTERGNVVYLGIYPKTAKKSLLGIKDMKRIKNNYRFIDRWTKNYSLVMVDFRKLHNPYRSGDKNMRLYGDIYLIEPKKIKIGRNNIKFKRN